MKIIYDNGAISKLKFKKPVLAIGIFDGVHLGHQLIIRRTVEEAKRARGTSIVLTFYPHPNYVLKHQKKFELLVSLKHRLRLIEKLNADVCIVVNFTKDFSDLPAEEFVHLFIINKINPRTIFVGADFVFGKDRSGNVSLLQRLGNSAGFKTIKIAPLKISGNIISSTLVRSLIKKGDLRKASLFLGRPVSILGEVTKGKGLGRSLGFPTANFFCSSLVMPPSGVYAVKAIINKQKFLGMAFNIGMLAVNSGHKRKANLEVYIFNFNKNIYDKEVEVEFYKKIRSVKRFKNKDSLRSQIENDAKEVKRLFSKPFLSCKTS